MGMNDLNIGFGLGEKMGLSPTTLNVAATGAATYGTIAQGVSSIGSAWSSYHNTVLNARLQQIGADMSRQNASAHLDDAREASRMAGRVQQTGEEAATNRYLQLAQDIGHVYSGAAGGGIDVSSATVRHVDRSMRLMAQRDVTAITRSAAESANQYARQASAHRRAYANDLFNANMADLQADYSKKVAKSQARAATWSAAGSMGLNLGVLALV